MSLPEKGKVRMFIEFSYPLDLANAIHDEAIQAPRVIERSRMSEGKPHNTSYFEMYAHTGTHIDSPWHFNNRGKKIHEFRIEEFVFTNVVLLQIKKDAWEEIQQEELASHAESIAQCDALLLHTGFGSAYRNSQPDVYQKGIPGMTMDAAKYLASYRNIRCIGVDFGSVENLQKNRPLGYPVHHALLDREESMILLEDANLAVLPQEAIHRIYLFPLRIHEIEASPVTAVAEYL